MQFLENHFLTNVQISLLLTLIWVVTFKFYTSKENASIFVVRLILNITRFRLITVINGCNPQSCLTNTENGPINTYRLFSYSSYEMFRDTSPISGMFWSPCSFELKTLELHYAMIQGLYLLECFWWFWYIPYRCVVLSKAAKAELQPYVNHYKNGNVC